MSTHGKENKVINIHNFTSLGRLYFLHGALGLPVKSTITEAIRSGYLISWPELTIENINKIDNPDHAIFGHMDQKRKNSQSTREKEEEEDRKITLASRVTNKTNIFMHSIAKFDDTIYTDQTGKFTHRSKRGYNYIFLMHCYDANTILERALKSKKESELVGRLEEIDEYLMDRGYKPQYQILDMKLQLK